MDDRRIVPTRTIWLGVALLTLIASACVPVMAQEATPRGQGEPFAVLANRCAPNIALGTLSAVVTHESSANPYAIHINNGQGSLTRQPASKAEAVAVASQLLAMGMSFDSGLGQVNSANLAGLGMGVAELFDPCRNLRAAASILSDCYVRAIKEKGQGVAPLLGALSCYNSNSLSAGIRSGYVGAVVAKAGVTVPDISSLKNSGEKPIEILVATLPSSGSTQTPASRSLASQKQPSADPAKRETDDGEPDIFSQPSTEDETTHSDSAEERTPEHDGG